MKSGMYSQITEFLTDGSTDVGRSMLEKSIKMLPETISRFDSAETPKNIFKSKNRKDRHWGSSRWIEKRPQSQCPPCMKNEIQIGLIGVKNLQERRHGNVPKELYKIRGTFQENLETFFSDQNLDLEQPIDQKLMPKRDSLLWIQAPLCTC